MFEMFKGLGQMASLLKNLPKLQEQMGQMQEALAQVSAEGDAGAGMVKARVNGKFEVVALSISEEAMKLNDREMLEDLIRAAVNQAMTRARQAVHEETTKLAANMGLPPGMNLPGMG